MLNLTFPSHLRRKTRACCFRLHFLSFFIPVPSTRLIPPPPRSPLSLSPTYMCSNLLLPFTSSCISSPYRAVSPWLADKCRFGRSCTSRCILISCQKWLFWSSGSLWMQHRCLSSPWIQWKTKFRRFFSFFFIEEWCFYVLCSGGISALPLLSRLKGHRVIRLNVS